MKTDSLNSDIVNLNSLWENNQDWDSKNSYIYVIK